VACMPSHVLCLHSPRCVGTESCSGPLTLDFGSCSSLLQSEHSFVLLSTTLSRPQLRLQCPYLAGSNLTMHPHLPAVQEAS
jgi:hypothetical protein